MPTVADLFSGAGGFSLGFSSAGFTPVFALDFDRWACETYSRNLGSHVICSPIGDLRVNSDARGLIWTARDKTVVTPPIDVLVGGPPCQGFSQLNRGANENDPRNSLWKQYYRILRGVSPRIFVIENVPQLLQSHEFTKLVRRARKRGYSVASGIINAEHFGVPQRRKRAFVIGVLGETVALPDATKCVTKRTDVRAAFSGLPLDPTNLNLHVARKPTQLSIERYAAVPPGGNRFDLPVHLQSPCWRNKPTGSTDVFGRMWYERPAPTIRTEFFKPEKGRYLHPEANRPITLREGARLQTFPDSFEFAGSFTQIAKQIGNAVPPSLARSIAEHLLRSYFVEDAAA